MIPPSRIVLCLESDGAAGAPVRYARVLAEKLDAALHVLYVVKEPLNADWTAEINAADIPRLHEGMEAAALEAVSTWIPQEEHERLRLTLSIGNGSPAEELARYAEAESPDLIVVGSRNETDRDGLAEFVEDVVSRVSCSVLVASD